MAIKTTIEQLESVQAQIEKIESGAQTYSSNGRSLTRADLKTLYEREAHLLAKYNLEQNNFDARTYAKQGGRSSS